MTTKTETETWNKECTKWYNKMNQISEFINKTREERLITIWDKFDKRHKEKLNASKHLTKLIYAFIVLLIKTKNRNEKPPDYKTLYSVIKYYANNIIKMLPTSQKAYITKHHFYTNISIYFKQMVKHNLVLINDWNQIGIFLAGCCNINTYQKNISLLFYGYIGHNTLHQTMPDEIIGICVGFCYNLEILKTKINECYTEVSDIYPYISNIDELCSNVDVDGVKWCGNNKFDHHIIRKVWRLKVSKSISDPQFNDGRFSFIIGISTFVIFEHYSDKYQFRVENGYIESSGVEIKNNDIISMVYVKYKTFNSYRWMSKIQLFVNDIPYPNIIDAEILCAEYLQFEMQTFSDIQVQILP